MSIKEFWAKALAARLFPLSIERGTKRPIGLWENNAYPTPEPDPEAVAVGIRCLAQDGVSALDFDCICAASDTYLAIMRRELGNVPVRYGRRPKFLIPFRCDGPIAGRSLALPCGCRVQIISGQFVAYGIHPDTQRPYEWEGFDYPWPVLSQVAVYGLLSYVGINATAEARAYMSELDVQQQGPQTESERGSVRQYVEWRLSQLTQEITGLSEGRGVPIFNAAASIMPAVHWGLSSIEEIGAAVERAGHSLSEQRGGRSLGEEITRAFSDGVLVGNPLVRKLQEYRTFIAQAVGNGITAGGATLEQIDNKTFQPLRFVVDDLMPEGFILFAAKPKVGKTYIMLEACLAVAEGSTFWGKQCAVGDVIYYSFEDNHRRIQDRYRALRPNRDGNKSRLLAFTGDSAVPRVAAVPGEPCFTQHLERELCKRPETKLVVIDPIVAVRADQRDKTKGLYQVDYDNIKAVQRIAMKYGITIVGVHHSNKKTDVQDAADMASGSTGMTAAADGVWIMEPDKARENAELTTQMRDADSTTITLAKRRIKGGIKWEPVEDAAQVATHNDIERRILVAMTAAGCEATILDLIHRCPDVNENTLRVYIRRMSSAEKQLIENTQRGLYVPRGAQPKTRPEGARDLLLTAALPNGSYLDFQAGKMVDVREVLPHMHNNDRTPVHEGYAVSMDAARSLLSLFHEPAKLLKDMESRKLVFVFDKAVLIPYVAGHVQTSAAPERPFAFPWTLAGAMQQHAEKMPWE